MIDLRRTGVSGTSGGRVYITDILLAGHEKSGKDIWILPGFIIFPFVREVSAVYRSACQLLIRRVSFEF